MGTIVPVGKRILLAEEKAQTVTSTGIIIEGSVGNTKMFKVMSVGSDVTNTTVGDTIFVDMSKGILCTYEGQQRVLIDSEFVLAIVR